MRTYAHDMRIVVSGTHASGKSTLVSAFADAHPEFTVLPDPFEHIDAAAERPGAETFAAQLAITARRLLATDDRPLIAERGPIDFLAYLDALDVLGRGEYARELFDRGVLPTARAMATVDLLVLLPLDYGIRVAREEDPLLRAATDDALRDLAEDPDVIGDTPVIELVGPLPRRLAQLEDAITGLR